MDIDTRSQANRRGIATIPVPQCPACNGSGELLYSDRNDPIYHTPGGWDYRGCTVCDTVWLDPRPAPESFGLIYPAGYYTHDQPPAVIDVPASAIFGPEVMRGFLRHGYGYSFNSLSPTGELLGRALSYIPASKRYLGHIVRFLPAHKGGRLLDVGCGNGTFLAQMSKLGWTVQGVELDHAAASIAREMGLKVDERSIDDIDLEPNSFDAITMNNVLEHLANPAAVIKKLGAALRPHGQLISISPNPKSFQHQWFGKRWRNLDPPRHFVLPGPRGVALMAEDAGLLPTTWTKLSLGAVWYIRESIGIARAGDASAYTGSILPRLFFALWLTVMWFKPSAGEEVVLMARKG